MGLFFALLTLVQDRIAPGGQEPDQEKEARERVDRLVRGASKATLGLLSEAISISIDFGAPAYNSGDREACSRFYSKTAESLSSAFEKGAATPQARRGLADLRKALDRASGMAGPDPKAWTLRFAFDKIMLDVRIRTAHVQALVGLGNENFKASRFAEAVEAFRQAGEDLEDLLGPDPEKLALDAGVAPIALGHALFALGRFKESSRSIVAGLAAVPSWTAIKLDRRAIHPDPAHYDSLVKKLESQAKDDPDLGFLLGYEYFFTGRKGEARKRFAEVLKAAPEHAGARVFLPQVKDGDYY